jgi:hypothetical protein
MGALRPFAIPTMFLRKNSPHRISAAGSRGEKRSGEYHAKGCFLLAAVLVIAAPLSAAMPTLTYAAGKAKKSAKRAVPEKRVVKKEAAKEVDPMEANTRFARALDDLFHQLATYRYVYDPATGGEAGKGGGKKAPKKAR